MTRLWADELLVQVQLDRRRLPAVLQLNGRRYFIARVVQQWEVDTDWWSTEGRAWRRHYAVLTRDAGPFCVVSYDVLADQWHLERIYD